MTRFISLLLRSHCNIFLSLSFKASVGDCARLSGGLSLCECSSVLVAKALHWFLLFRFLFQRGVGSFLEFGEVKVNIIRCGIFQILSLLLCKPQCACSNLHCTRIPCERWHSVVWAPVPVLSPLIPFSHGKQLAQPLTAPGAWRSLTELFWAPPRAPEPEPPLSLRPSLPLSLCPSCRAGCMRCPGCGLLPRLLLLLRWRFNA